MIDKKVLSFNEVKQLIREHLGPSMVKLDTDGFAVISKNKETMEALIICAYESTLNALVADIAELAMTNAE